MSPQSHTPTNNGGHNGKLNGVRTYRGRELEDLIPQIRAELGPDAIILRQREGLTGGMGGFFAQKCVEVDAQAAAPRVDIYDEPEVDQESPSLIEAFYMPSGGIDATIDQLPTVEPSGLSFGERLQEAAGLIAETAAPVTPEPPQPIISSKPIITEQAPAPVAEPAPAPVQAPTQRAFAAQQMGQLDGDDAAALADDLVEQGISESWARQLIDEAAAHRSPLAFGKLRDAVRATLASTLPSPASLPAAGAAIAFVGAGGSGKTRCTASLAAAYARASTLATSVVALGGEDWGAEVKDLLKGRSTWVTVAPTAHDANAAVQSGRQNGMVVVDTPAISPRDEAAIQALAAELSSLDLDAMYITIPATFSVHAAKRLVESFAALGVDGIAVTQADEAEQLGVAVEHAHISGVPIAYVHDGLELDGALSAADPTSLAARLLP